MKDYSRQSLALHDSLRGKISDNFEKYIYENGTIILKFFLHISKDEQKKRFISRIDDPSKNWKFSKIVIFN